MRLTVEKVEQRQGSKGTYYVVHYGEGKRVFCWDSKVAQSLRPGATYDVEIKDGDFPKLTRATEVAAAEGAPPAQAAPDVATLRAIAALEAASRVAGPCNLTTPGEVLRAAELFLSWLELMRAGDG